jgi:hypothetical protein
MQASFPIVQCKRAAPLALLVMFMLAAVQSRASTLWRTPWVANEPPTFHLPPYPGPDSYGVAFADNGDVLLGSYDYLGSSDVFVTRFGIDGTLRWNGVAHGPSPALAIVPAADGGAFATFSTTGRGYAARFDADGHTLWARDGTASWIAPIDTERVAVADCQSASLLDAATGVVRWYRLVAQNYGCISGGMAVDASTIYTIAPRAAGPLYLGQRFAAFDLEGTVRWQRDVDAIAEDASLLGIGGPNAYLGASDETIAVRTSDGSIAWRAPATGRLLAGASRDAIVDSPDGLERLDASDGHVRWTAPVGAHADPAALIGDAILAVTSGGLSRVDPETGAIVWTVPLPKDSPDGHELHWIAMGGLANGAFSIVAFTYDMQSFVQRVDFASGALAGTVAAPSIEKGIAGSAEREGSDIVGMHLDNDVLHMIDIGADAGEVRWTARTPIDLPGTSYDFDSAYTIGPSRVAVAIPFTGEDSTPPPSGGLVCVVAYDRATGDKAWGVALYDAGELEPAVSTPLVNAAGDVIVPIGMLGPPWGNHQAIIKLAGTDGTVAWRIDNTLSSNGVNPPTLVPVGDDFLVHGPFDDSSATLRRFSGGDGSVQWESSVFPDTGVASVYRIDDTRIVAIAASTAIYKWAMLDAATGTALWTSTAACGADASCYVIGGVGTTDGDVTLPAMLGASDALTQLGGDGSGSIESWPVADTSPDLVTRLDLAGEGDGLLGFVLRRSGSRMGSGGWYGQLDPRSGDVSFQNFAGLPVGTIASGSLITAAIAPAARPSGVDFSRVDMTISAHGNLVASVTIDRNEVSPGQALGFRLTATYTGDAALPGANLRGILGWPSGATDLSCTGTGISNCVLDSTVDRNIDATFDIEPGGEIDVTGRILVIDDFPATSQRWIGMRVVGPPELDETGTIDNFAQAVAVQALFASGFDRD